MWRIPYVIIFTFFSLYCGAQKQVSFSILDDKNEPIPFVNIFLNDKYHISCDSLGFAKLSVLPTDLIKFTSVGHFGLEFRGSSIQGNKREIVLRTRIINLKEVEIKNTPKIFLNSSLNNKKVRRSYKTYQSFEEAVVFERLDIIDRQIMELTFYAGFHNTPACSVSVSFYTLNENQLPEEIIATKEVQLISSNHLRKFKIDLSEQSINILHNGLAVGFKFVNNLNPKNSFDESSYPILGISKNPAKDCYSAYHRQGLTWRKSDKRISPIYVEMTVK